MPLVKKSEIGFPVFAVAFAPKKQRLFVGGGGGANNSGVKNSLVRQWEENDEITIIVQLITLILNNHIRIKKTQKKRKSIFISHSFPLSYFFFGLSF